ncbi:MAG: hypothetical protein ACOX9R_06915 [Armatimonadota bacterium]
MTEADRPMVTEDRPGLRLSAGQWLLVALFGLLVAVGCRDMHFNADTLHYVDVARTWIEDGTLATWHLNLTTERVPATEVLWPPMYSILLGGPLALGLSPEAATWLIAVLSQIALLWLLVAVSRRVEWGLLVGLLFVYMMFVHGIAFRAFSETPFIALVFGALVAMALALQGGGPEGGRSRALWLGLLAGVLAAAAALTRHIGVALIPTLGLLAVVGPLRHQVRAWRVRATALASMVVGSALPLGLWFARHAMLGSSVFGPDRPPSEFTLYELLMRLGHGVYMDASTPLLVLATAVLGYHLLDRDGGDGRRAFALSLAGAALLYAVLHEAGTVASHAMYRMDNPPEGRQFFPGYVALLLILAALLSLARPPERVLRRRWPILAVLVIPLATGTLIAGSVSHDLTPVRSAVDEWVEANTAPDDLIIGWRAWPVRFHTGRPVLQSGMVSEPSVYDGPAVASFLQRFGSHFGGAWLLVPEASHDEGEVIADFRAAGLELERAAELNVAGLRHYRGVETIAAYRLTGWR